MARAVTARDRKSYTYDERLAAYLTDLEDLDVKASQDEEFDFVLVYSTGGPGNGGLPLQVM